MPARNQICDLLNIQHPILLAPMAMVSGGALASAVTKAGGLGMIGGGYGDENWLQTEYQALENCHFGIGFITWSLAKQPQLLSQALKRSPVAVMLSFGDPSPFIPDIKKNGCKVICQVQTVADAKNVAALGADIIIAQGSEAGGHGSHRGLASLLPAIVDAAGDIPVLAAGGLTENRDLQAAAMLGASGALIGTRFFASHEALGHPNAKQRLVTVAGDDTIRTTTFDVARGLDWPSPFTVRAIKNDFTQAWHGNEAEMLKNQSRIVENYSEATKAGDTDVIGVFAGEGLDRISSIEPTDKIFQELISTKIPWA